MAMLPSNSDDINKADIEACLKLNMDAQVTKGYSKVYLYQFKIKGENFEFSSTFCVLRKCGIECCVVEQNLSIKFFVVVKSKCSCMPTALKSGRAAQQCSKCL